MQVSRTSVLLALLLATMAFCASALTITIPVSKDAQVTYQSKACPYPTCPNEGSSSSIVIGNYEITSEGLFGFTLASIPASANILSASLHLPTGSSPFGSQEIALSVFKLTDNTAWTESTVVWDNKPSFDTPAIGSVFFSSCQVLHLPWTSQLLFNLSLIRQPSLLDLELLPPWMFSWIPRKLLVVVLLLSLLMRPTLADLSLVEILNVTMVINAVVLDATTLQPILVPLKVNYALLANHPALTNATLPLNTVALMEYCVLQVHWSVEQVATIQASTNVSSQITDSVHQEQFHVDHLVLTLQHTNAAMVTLSLLTPSVNHYLLGTRTRFIYWGNCFPRPHVHTIQSVIT